MCGIMAAARIDDNSCANDLVQGLTKLEYRGYDSAGIATLSNNKINVTKTIERVKNLVKESGHQAHGSVGIAHTRWATHGEPCVKNSHPHVSFCEEAQFALVHNGIIENHSEIRAWLEKEGYVFKSDTDTEVLVHLTHKFQKTEKSLLKAVYQVVQQIEGSYAFAVISSTSDTKEIVAARNKAPLLIGHGQDGKYLASDVGAILHKTNRISHVPDKALVRITPDQAHAFTFELVPLELIETESTIANDELSLGSFKHYMLKEIFEQPKALEKTLCLGLSCDKINPLLFGPGVSSKLEKIENILILACGTSLNAGAVAKYWLEDLANTPVSVEIASEYRYRKSVMPKNCLVIAISQSGETADTLAAVEHAKAQGAQMTLAICNVPESSLVRACSHKYLTQAGPEIGVASTKAFLTQLGALFYFSASMAKAKNQLEPKTEALIIKGLAELSCKVQEVLGMESLIKSMAQYLVPKKHALFLGRGAHYPLAHEGALKLKEISYIHAEAYAAGELKHGPLALIDSEMPIVISAPNDALLDKVKSNLQEVKARGGQVLIFTEEKTCFAELGEVHTVGLPIVEPWFTVFTHAVALQLLAYHVALEKGTDIDKPRNLAKSVTVE